MTLTRKDSDFVFVVVFLIYFSFCFVFVMKICFIRSNRFDWHTVFCINKSFECQLFSLVSYARHQSKNVKNLFRVNPMEKHSEERSISSIKVESGEEIFLHFTLWFEKDSFVSVDQHELKQMIETRLTIDLFSWRSNDTKKKKKKIILLFIRLNRREKNLWWEYWWSHSIRED